MATLATSTDVVVVAAAGAGVVGVDNAIAAPDRFPGRALVGEVALLGSDAFVAGDRFGPALPCAGPDDGESLAAPEFADASVLAEAVP